MLNKLNLFLGFPKTLFINLRYFKFKDAIKLPIIVSNKTMLKDLSGKIIIDAPLKTGILKIGFGDVSIFDREKSRTILYITGTMVIKGKTFIGHGSKISVNKNGLLTLGENFRINAESTIVCSYKITFGAACLISWENLIMDTDFHKITNNDNIQINQDTEISFGNHVWIGCRCTILKGTVIGDNTVVAANSLLFNKIQGTNQIIGGNPTRVLRSNVAWNL